MDRLQRIFGQGGLGAAQAQPGVDTPMVDNAEMVYISSLALLKMLKHGRAGVPMEVMGLMLGEFVDDYTVSYSFMSFLVFSCIFSGLTVAHPLHNHATIFVLSEFLLLSNSFVSCKVC